MKSFTHVHLIGIGGIHVSAVARLLKARGFAVSGSDSADGEEIARLRAEGIVVTIGHAAANVPAEANMVVYSDAVPEDNVERVEAERRGISLADAHADTHAFLGHLFADAQQIVITGTHGKSTTTAMVGKILEAAGENPTVVVGTRVPGWEYGNLRIGREDLLVVEGDEYKSHVLSYRPTVLAITNMEWDHPDIFPTMDMYIDLFRRVIKKVVDHGVIVRGGDVPPWLISDNVAYLQQHDVQAVTVEQNASVPVLLVPGRMNHQNAALARATVLAYKKDISTEVIDRALADFPGVWRRFERVGEFNGAPVISDYGHHPTEVRETLMAAREAFPRRRIVLCFQPHQRARTKELLEDFLQVLALPGPEQLILAEIYHVPGREEVAYADISSKDIVEELNRKETPSSISHVGVPRALVRYAPDITDAEQQLRALAQPNDLILVMGAGTIDKVARRLVRIDS